MTAPVPARRVDAAPARPGEFEWAYEATDIGEGIAGMAFRCPCGCGFDGFLDFSPARSPSWRWDGDAAKPTLAEPVTLGRCPNESRWRLFRGLWRHWAWQ